MNVYHELDRMLSPEWVRSGPEFTRKRSGGEWASISVFADRLKPDAPTIFVQAFNAECPPDPAKEAAYQAEFGEPQEPGRGLVQTYVVLSEQMSVVREAAAKAEWLWGLIEAGKLIDTIVSMREPDPATSGAASA